MLIYHTPIFILMANIIIKWKHDERIQGENLEIIIYVNYYYYLGINIFFYLFILYVFIFIFNLF